MSAAPQPETCPTCRGRAVVRDLEPGQLSLEVMERASRIRLCTCVASCRSCGGDRYVVGADEHGYDLLTPCPQCDQAERLVALWNAALVPARYEHATIEGYRPEHRTQHGALQSCRSWIASWRPQRRGLLLCGPTGTGKTHLCVALLRLLVSRGVRCWFVRSRDLLEGLRSRYRRQEASREELTASQYRRRLVTVPVLLLDELAELRTEWQREAMSDVIESRYNASATTLVTSNVDPEEVGGLFGEAGRRVTSRLVEMCEVVVVGGEDWRQRSAP